MTLRLKLVALILFVSLIPLTVLAFVLLSLHQEASSESVSEIHVEKANHGAYVVRTYFDTFERSLTSAVQSIQWAELTPEERVDALWLAYRQRDEIAAMSLLDQNGERLSDVVYLDAETSDETLAKHPGASMPVLQGFAEHLPFAAARDNGLALSEVYAPRESQSAFFAIGIRVSGARGTPWVVAACISLESLCADLESSNSGRITTYLIDPLGRPACHPDQSRNLKAADGNLLRLVPTSTGEIAGFQSSSGEELVAAASEALVGWRVVAEQPASAAYATSDRMRNRAIQFVGLGILVALTIGFFLARSISRLSTAFNKRSEEIASRDGENRSLKRDPSQRGDLTLRVEQRTKNLKEAQQQIIHSQTIAAVTALGAGIAHEINNPLTGVIGLTQVLRKEDEEAGRKERVEVLRNIEEEALRVKKIIKRFLSLSQEYAGEGFVPLNPLAILDESIAVIEEEARDIGVDIVREYESEMPKVLGNRAQLQQVILQLMSNALTAMPNGGRIVLSASSFDGQIVKIAVSDSGKGIPKENLEKILDPFFTTKEDSKCVGLGLTVAFRIIEQHHGTIRPTSELGKGASMLITLPAAKGGAHLV